MTSRIIVAALAFLSLLAPAPGMSLEEAGEMLSADDFTAREEAEATLRNGGSEALAILEQLLRSDSPEVRERASKARDWIRYGLNDQIPKELCDQLLQFNDLPVDQQSNVLRTLGEVKPGQMVALAHLHSRIARRPGDAQEPTELNTQSARLLSQKLSAAPIQPTRFDPLLLHVTTRALILNALASDKIDNLLETYSTWLALDESLRHHLDNRGVALELKRLQSTDDLPGALELLSVLKDSNARSWAITAIRPRIRLKPDLPILELTQTQAAAYLEVMCDPSKPKEIYATYLQLHQKHPDLPTILPAAVRVLEVFRLLEIDEFYPAFDLAWATQNEPMIRSSGLLEVGQWAAENPAKLVDGLPDVAEDGNHQLRPFFTGLAPIKRDTPPAEIEAITTRFSELDLRSPRPGSWVSAAFSIGHIDLYVHTMALRERLDEVIAGLGKLENDNRLFQVGKVLGGHPALCEHIEFKTHPTRALRQILAGFLQAGRDFERLVLAAELATRWEEVHPDLFDPAHSADLAPLVAHRHWQQGNYHSAVELLASDERNQYRNVRYVASFLGMVDDIGIARQLDTKLIHTEFLTEVISAIQDNETSTARQLRMALALNEICRTRSGGVSGGFNLYKSRKLAYTLWRQGHDDLAYRLMEEAFWSDDDPEETRLGLFPELALLLGKIDEALARADAAPKKEDRDLLRHAYLLAAADRPDEALALAKKFPKSKLYPLLLSETGDWATLGKIPRTSDKRFLTEAWCAYLAGDMEAGRRHLRSHQTQYLNPSLQILLGDYNEVLLADFKQEHTYRGHRNLARRMARDHLLLAYCEEELMTAVEVRRVVPYQAMRVYFENLELLPDLNRAILLAKRLGELPQAGSDRDPWFRNDDWKAWAHKTLSVSALARLERRDLALAQLHTMLGDADDLSAIPEFHQRVLLRGLLGEELSSSDALQKLSKLEQPDSTAAQRVEFLSNLTQEPDVEKRVTTMLAIAKQHQNSLDDKEVTELITKFSRLLGQPRGNAAALKRPKEQRLADFRPVAIPGEKHEAQSEKYVPPNWTMASPRIGKLSDPKADIFSISDGIARVRDLWKEDQKDDARTLMREITTRTLLDEKFVSRKVDIMLRSVAGKSSRSSSFHPISPEAALVCFRFWDLPSEVVLPATRAFLNMPTSYESSDRIKWASEVYAKHGELRRALQTRRIYQRLAVSQTPGLGDALDDASRLLTLEMLSAQQAGDHDLTLDTIRCYLQLDPYQTEPIATVLRRFHAADHADAIRELDGMLTSFWQNKLLRLPKCRAYQAALDDWKSLVKDLAQPKH